jgi:hypothetical protein
LNNGKKIQKPGGLHETQSKTIRHFQPAYGNSHCGFINHPLVQDEDDTNPNDHERYGK